MFNTMLIQLKKIATSEAIEICDKADFMDKTIFYNAIKNMTIEEISQISMNIILTHSIKEMNKGFKVTKCESIIKKVM